MSNWPMFMDAAGQVGNKTIARIFFYSFKVYKRDYKIVATEPSVAKSRAEVTVVDRLQGKNKTYDAVSMLLTQKQRVQQ